MITLLSTSFHHAAAQAPIDSTKKPLLGALDKSASPNYLIAGANVVFPEILKGNEAEMMPYIEKFSNNRRDYLVRMYSKGKTFLSKAANVLKKYDLPSELRVLLALESSYNGNAVSKAGAVGYWQIMDEVAREYGMKYIAQMSAAEKKRLLKQKKKNGEKQRKALVKLKDDRKNFNIATHTAARYLSDRRKNLDDNWLLVVASYNCGIGNVRKAIKKSEVANPTFWDVKKYLPAETRAYVMNFITLNVIFNNYEMFAKNKLSFASQKIKFPNALEENISEPPMAD
ncbi:MAG: lytic transglycosylase domain-containing protein [Ferruginibacter sp.]